jgi:hypothetical protein
VGLSKGWFGGSLASPLADGRVLVANILARLRPITCHL